MSNDKELKEKSLNKVTGGDVLEPDFSMYFCPKCMSKFNNEEELRTHQMKCFSGTNYVKPGGH